VHPPAHRAREMVGGLVWVWSTMQDHVYWAKVRDVDDLKQRLIDVWDSLEQSVIDDTIDQWLSRICARGHAKRGHFEQS